LFSRRSCRWQAFIFAFQHIVVQSN
jgi:hypothetical protein